MILFFPTVLTANKEVTWDNFNYTIIVVSGMMVIAWVYWNLPFHAGAKHFYKGPHDLKKNEGLPIETNVYLTLMHEGDLNKQLLAK